MSISANRKYKESGSDVSFKDWLKDEQEKGELADHETMFNADGLDDTPPTIKKAKKNMFAINMIGVVALGCLVYGLSQTSEA
jgi:hypothetical protein